MTPFYFFLSLIPFYSWVYIVFFHGRKLFSTELYFWTNKIIFEKFYNNVNTSSKNKVDKICVIIPARNEEDSIGNTLKSIIDQKIDHLEIILIDDNSTDKTTSRAKLKMKKEKFQRFKLLRGKTLPKGWSGKTWALKQGVDYALKRNHKYFLFLDSEIIVKDCIIRDVKNFLENNKLLMVSLMAKLNCSNFWEKLLIPSFIFFFQKLYPFNEVNDHRKKIAAAAGGFIFCESKIFESSNLYDQIKNKVIDDCNLAKLIKKKGRIWLGLTDRVVCQRKYQGLYEIWMMVSRTAFEQLNHSILLLLFSVLGLISIYILPFINLYVFFKQNNFLLALNVMSIFLMTASIIPTINFYKLKFWYYFSLPISGFLYLCMTLSSAYNHFFKNGNNWKGRTY